MTMPTLVMLLSSAFWLLLETVAVPRGEGEWPNFHRWLKETCRIIFAASVLVVLWSSMTERAF